MKLISSPWTRFIKWISPLAWLGAIGYLLVDGAMRELLNTALVAVLVAAAAAGLLLMKIFLWRLADEVYDCGDALLVRLGRLEERVPFADIESVRLALYSRPPRITLHLARPGKLGRSIVFSPSSSPGRELFGRNPVADDLLARVQRAR